MTDHMAVLNERLCASLLCGLIHKKKSLLKKRCLVFQRLYKSFCVPNVDLSALNLHYF